MSTMCIDMADVFHKQRIIYISNTLTELSYVRSFEKGGMLSTFQSIDDLATLLYYS